MLPCFVFRGSLFIPQTGWRTALRLAFRHAALGASSGPVPALNNDALARYPVIYYMSGIGNRIASNAGGGGRCAQQRHGLNCRKGSFNPLRNQPSRLLIIAADVLQCFKVRGPCALQPFKLLGEVALWHGGQ
jgi:hypothetical protein